MLVVYDMSLQYPSYHCITPMFLFVNNSDSPSIVEQSQQGHDSSCNSLLTVIPSSVKYPIPYACQLAFCNASMPCSIPSECFLLCLILLCVSLCESSCYSLPGLVAPFYLGCFLFAPRDSLSDYVHPGIAFWLSRPPIRQVHSGSGL